jgi:hypothetical protein
MLPPPTHTEPRINQETAKHVMNMKYAEQNVCKYISKNKTQL